MTDNDDFHDRAFLNVLGWIRRRVADGESDSENKNGVPRMQSPVRLNSWDAVVQKQ
ncbi:hypothetical protein ACOCG7_13580 [Paraburkholderia sp. DD10]|uniref:hypothetical protein n=1 Tax=Paraburkholderia sp. DD10 TaxID=3409691 RepID=UPI003BA38183